MKEQILAVQRMQDYIEKNRTEEISLSVFGGLLHIVYTIVFMWFCTNE